MDHLISWHKDENSNTIKCCTLGDKRLAKTAAKVLFELYTTLDTEIRKPSLCLSVWGRHDYFIRRSLDVQLVNIRKFLEGSEFMIESKRHNYVKLCLRK